MSAVVLDIRDLSIALPASGERANAVSNVHLTVGRERWCAWSASRVRASP